MKKIKGILLFGILTLFGIGSSFGVDVNNVFGSITDSVGTRHFYSNIATNSDSIFFMGMYNNNIGNVLFPNSQSNISSYNNVMYWANFNTMGNIAFVPGSDVKKIGTFTVKWSNPYISYYINGSGNFGFNYLHLFYLGGSSSKYSNYYMTTSTGIYSSGLTIYDIQPGYERKKIFPLVSSSFSSISSNGTDFEFSYIPFDGISSDGIYNITGIVLFHFDFYTGGYISGNNTIILFKDNSNIYYNIFDSYSDSVLDFVDSTPISKGVLSNGYSSFVNMIQDNGYMVEIYGNSSSLIFHSIDSQTTASTFTNVSTTLNTHPYNEYTFDLTENSSVSHWYDFLNGGETQSTGSIAINTGFLDLCLNNLEFGELNSYLCNKLLNGNNLVLIPNMTGYYLSYGFDENGNLRFWITYQEDLEQQMSGFVWVQDENGERYTTCPSGDCLGTILTHPINHGNTGFEFTTGTVLDMITNLTGWVGRCPFPYTDFRLGKNLKLLQTLQNYGFEYDPFIIVNCAVAGFHYGRHSIDRQIFDDIFEHPLLYGDTQKHRSLFVFLDFIVILGLFGLSAFLKKIF